MVSTFVFAFKIIRPIIFSAVKKVSFPQFLISENSLFFHSQGIFQQSWKFSTNKKLFHKKNSTNKEVFLKVFFLDLRKFPQRFLYSQKKFTSNKDQKGSLKAKLFKSIQY